MPLFICADVLQSFKVEEVGYGIKKLRVACVVEARAGEGEVDTQSIMDAIAALHAYPKEGHHHKGGHEHHGHSHTHGEHGAGVASTKLVQSVELVAVTA